MVNVENLKKGKFLQLRRDILVMRIGVCLKEVLDSNCSVRLNAEKNSIISGGQKFIVNPYDEFALEEALRHKEKYSNSEIITFTIGPERANATICTGLAMGADKAIHIVHDKDMFIDGLGIASILKKILEVEKVDILLLGKQSTDYSKHEVGPMLAGLLEWPQAMNVVKLDVKDEYAMGTCESDGWKSELFRLKMPCVIGVTKGINEPRFPTLKGTLNARKKEIKKIQVLDLGINTEMLNGVEVEDVYLLPERNKCRLITGDPELAAKELVRLLREDERLI